MDEESILKIIGALTGLFAVRKAYKIIAGKDGMDVKELYELVALFFFVFFGAYIIIKEGARVDCNSHVYNEWYLGIVFGSLLTILHLDSALDKIIRLIEAIKSKDKITNESKQ